MKKYKNFYYNKKVLTQFRLWPLLTSQLKGIPGLEKKYCRNYSFSARRLIALTFQNFFYVIDILYVLAAKIFPEKIFH